MTRHSSAPSGTKFDPSFYPRTYMVSTEYKAHWIVAGFAFGIGIPFILFGAHGSNLLQKTLLSLPALLLGIYLVLEAFKLKVILEADAIIVKHTFSNRRLLRCEIAGWRNGNGGRGTTTRILVPNQNGMKVLKFPEIMQPDSTFFAWFVGIPDLNSPR